MTNGRVWFNRGIVSSPCDQCCEKSKNFRPFDFPNRFLPTSPNHKSHKTKAKRTRFLVFRHTFFSENRYSCTMETKTTISCVKNVSLKMFYHSNKYRKRISLKTRRNILNYECNTIKRYDKIWTRSFKMSICTA